MRTVSIILLFVATLVQGSVSLAGAPQMDQLFDQLLVAPDEATAIDIENQIWQRWFESGDNEIDALMDIAMSQRQVYDFAGALETLDRVIAMAPDYAEGWNQRATVLFMLGRDAESIRDIRQVLRIEPRHFGALAGLGLIHMRAKNWKSAIASFERALKLHPFLGERAFIPALKKKLEGTAL